jgi:hypothetical protein
VDTGDEPLATPEQLALEMTTLAPMELTLRPESAFQLVALLQLALRHPDVPEGPARIARTFITGAREYFASCPSIVQVLDRGNGSRG